MARRLRAMNSESTCSSSLACDELTIELPNVIAESAKANVYQPNTAKANKLLRKPTSETHKNMHRSSSAQSLPVPKIIDTLTPYEKLLRMSYTDQTVQREIVLGKRIGFYKLGKELGSGTFSKVKIGVHLLVQEKVAIKIMDRSKMDQKAQRLLAREVNVLEQLHHPNIIRLFECVETISRSYLIMEYAGGGELYSYVQSQGHLTEEDGKKIFAQVVSAVSHMHSKGIIHRDIKPENVISSQPGWVKLVDFGFSCQIEDGTKLSTFCGSPPYAAPELFKDEKYDGQMVDIWALGVLLYFILVGTTPFHGESLAKLKHCILRGIYPIPEHVSSFAQRAIGCMLQINPERRINIHDLKRTNWLRDCKFTKEYKQFSVTPNEEELNESSVIRAVWDKLQSYGIDVAMIKDAASKGAKNEIIGTYRILLHQAQREYDEMERARIHDQETLARAFRNHQPSLMVGRHSKMCELI